MRLLTLGQCAFALNVDYRTFKNWTERGKIPYLRENGTGAIWIRESDLRTFLARHGITGRWEQLERRLDRVPLPASSESAPEPIHKCEHCGEDLFDLLHDNSWGDQEEFRCPECRARFLVTTWIAIESISGPEPVTENVPPNPLLQKILAPVAPTVFRRMNQNRPTEFVEKYGMELPALTEPSFEYAVDRAIKYDLATGNDRSAAQIVEDVLAAPKIVAECTWENGPVDIQKMLKQAEEPVNTDDLECTKRMKAALEKLTPEFMEGAQYPEPESW